MPPSPWTRTRRRLRASIYRRFDRQLLRGEREHVAIEVLEDGRRSPGFLFWGLLELDAARAQVLISLLYVIAEEDDVRKRADPVFLAVRSEQYDFGLAAGDAQFDPALPAVEGLIGENLKAEFLSVEFQRLVLIPDWNADELHCFDHGCPPGRDQINRGRVWCQPDFV